MADSQPPPLIHLHKQYPSNPTKAKAHLDRVRDNQRRSRARRKEYLVELEDKFRQCEQLGVEASSEMQAAARAVLAENTCVSPSHTSQAPQVKN